MIRKRKKRVVFQKIQQNHINHFQKLMTSSKTKNLSLCQKRKRMVEEFPNLEISRSTVWKMQRKLLSYSYKRIC
jgi:uncharacterized membrane protein